ncbi:MAG: alpha/beta hydrolase-fold protein [Muribaculaceae bacterium]
MKAIKFVITSLMLSLSLSCVAQLAVSPMKISSGKLQRVVLNSEYMNSMTVDIWTPDGYPKATSYKVLYMHDGQMLFDKNSTWNKQAWEVDSIAGEMLNDGKLSPFIVVGIHSTAATRTADLMPERVMQYIVNDSIEALMTKMIANNLRGDRYLKFIVTELKPFIDKNYKVDPSRGATAVMGSSMGGLMSMYAICEYPTVFGSAACLSTHLVGLPYPNVEIPTAICEYLKNHLPNPKTHRIYFDHGDQTLDALYPPYQKMVDSVMLQKGYSTANWITCFFKGHAHQETAWASRLHIPLSFLFPATLH